MSNWKAIIIDDERSARNILFNLLETYCSEIEVVDQCEDLVSGAEAIKALQPSLVFLDIEMPNYAGYEIVSFFERIDFEIIFITAYDNYAIKAFELSALDYLLKPIDINRLKQSIERFKEKSIAKKTELNYKVLVDSLQNETVKKIVVQVPGGQKIVEVKDIVAFTANESYSYILTNEGSRFIYSKNLKYFENLLEDNENFIRTHKSWIVNINYLNSYSKSNFTIDLDTGIQAKLSKYKKDDFEKVVLR